MVETITNTTFRKSGLNFFLNTKSIIVFLAVLAITSTSLGNSISHSLDNFDTYNSPPMVSGGELTLERWLGIGGTSIANLTSSSNYPDAPNETSAITSFQGPVNYAENYGTRVRGYIIPSESGSFDFNVTGDDNIVLYLSTDQNSANKTEIGSIPGWTNITEHSKYTTQTELGVNLTAGNLYYVELLQKEGGGGDHFQVYWRTPSNPSTWEIIPSANLFPFGVEEICDNGIDDDGDNQIDCEDIDCGMLINREFDEGSNDWFIWNNTGYTSSFSIDQTSQVSGENSAFIDITQLGSSPTDWHIQFGQNGHSLTSGTTYEVFFDAKATAPRPLVASVQLENSPWTGYAWEYVTLSTETTTYSFSFVATETITDVKLYFALGESDEDVWIDNVQLKEVCVTCEADAGPDQSQCQNAVFNVQANTPSVGANGVWSVVSGSASTYEGWNAPSNTFSIPTGTTVLRWTVSGGGLCSEYDEITLTNTTGCSVDCIDPLNINVDLEDNGTISDFPYVLNGSELSAIDGENNPAGWEERYGAFSPDPTNFNGAFYVDASSSGDAHSGNHMVYLKGTTYCLSPLATSVGLACGKTYRFSVWVAAYSHPGIQGDAPFALEYSAGSEGGTPPTFAPKLELSAPASQDWNNLNWNRYIYEFTIPADGYEWSDFYFTTYSDQHGILVDDLCITELDSGSEANAGADILGCTNTFNLQANTPAAGYNGTWSVESGDISISPINSPTATATMNTGSIGEVVWTVTDGNCLSSDRLVLSFEDEEPLVPQGDEICEGETAQISVSGCTGDLEWETGQTTSSISVSPASTRSYSVTCTGGESANLISNGDLESSIDFENWNDWGGAGIITDVAHVYEGSKAAIIDASSAWGGMGQTISVQPGEKYTLSFYGKTTNANKQPYFEMGFFNSSWTQLSDVNEVIITTTEYGFYTISGIAPENSAYLQIGAGVSSPATIYLDDIKVTKNTSCDRVVSVDVIVNPLPKVSASNDGPFTCTKTSVTLTADQAGMVYSWSGGGSGQMKTVTSVGTYYVTITDANGCEAVASTTVSEDYSGPTISVSSSGFISCDNNEVVLTANPAGLTYAWSDGSSNQTMTATDGGIYSVTVTGTNGCTSEASTFVFADTTAPTVSVEDIEACEGDVSTLSPELCENYGGIISQRPLKLNGWNNTYGNQRSALIGDGELCFTLDSLHLSSAQMIGLNDNPSASNSYGDMEFALYLNLRSDQNKARIQIRESGTFIVNGYDGPVDIAGSTFCIKRTGSTIEYLMDGAVVYTSLKSSNTDLYYDHTFYSGGGVWTGGYSALSNINLCGDVEMSYLWETGETTKSIDVTVMDDYSLTVTDANGCTTAKSGSAIFYPNPTISVNNDGPGTCDDPIVTITAAPAGMTYLWEDGSTNQTRDVNAEGTYFVTVTDENLCSSVSSTVVTYADVPTAEVTGETDLCLGETTTLSPTSGGSWTSSNTEVAIVSSDGNVASIGAGTVTFTFTDSNTGCVSSATEVVTVYPSLSVAIDYNDALCLEDGSELGTQIEGGTAPFQYTWEGPNGLNETTETIAIVESGNYYLTVTDAAGCTAQTSGYVYEQYDPFIFTLSTQVCEGEDVTLTVNSGSAVAFQWDANASSATTPSVTVTPSPPSSTYYVTVTNDVGCTSVATAIIDVDAKTAVAVTGASDICVGETTQLSPTTGGTWISSNTAIAGVSSSGLVTGLGSGSVTFTFTSDDTNCDSDPTTPITVNPKATATITGPTTLCTGETTSLTPSSGGTWESSNESVATVSNDGVVTTVGPGTATFTFTNTTTGCISDATSSITVNTTPNAEINGPSEICIGDQTFLTPTSGGTWSSSNSGVATINNSGVVTGISEGTSIFTFTTSYGCSIALDTPITVSNNLNVTIDGEPFLCEGETQILTASVGGGVWSSNNTGIATIDANTGEVTAITAGNVIITYDNSGSGCFSDAEMALEVKDTPTGYISGSVNICVGEVTSLTSSTTGLWTSNDTDVAIISSAGDVVGIAGGSVTFTFTADNGCASVETGVLTVNPEINVSVDFGEMECLTDDMQLTANVTGGSAGIQYSWTGPGGFASDQQIIDVPTNGNYDLVVTDGAGCSTSTTAFVYAAYDPFIFALNTEVCEGESVTLSVNSSSVAEFQWSANANNSTAQSVTVIPSSPSSTYNVTVTNNVGCSTVANAEIVVHALPEIELTGNSTICEGATTTFTPTTGGFWTSSDYNVATINNSGVVTGLNPGTATFTFRDATTDCVSEASQAITVGNNTIVSINGNDQLCPGVPETLTTSASGGTWSSSNTSIVTVNALGELNPIAQGTAVISYTFSSNECYEDGTLEVTVNGTPTTNINGPSTICEGEQTYLLPTTGGTWSSNDETVAIVSSFGIVTGVTGGTATFTFTSDYGCTKTLDTPVTVLPSPEISFTGPSSICINENTTLSPTTGGIWISSNNNIATVNSSGMVTGENEGTVTFTFVEFENGCVSDDELTLVVNGKPTISSPASEELCIGESTSITPTTGGVWTSLDPTVAEISNDGTITAIGAGATSFVFTNSITGCSSNASSPIVIEGNPSINLLGPDVLCIGETSTITPTSGGSWSSTDVSIATITNQGEITAVGAGNVQFIFTSNSTGCKSDSSEVITVTEPTTIEITGDAQICVGETTSMTPTSGGTWESSDENIATITNNGLVTGHAPGVVTFTFNSSGSCSSSPSSEITISPKPIVGFTGATDICVGSTTELSPSSGGIWVSNDPSIATVTAQGVVTGVASGSVNFVFTDNESGCSAQTESLLNVFDGPTAIVSGADEICIGEVSSMYPSSGGTWTSNNPEVATITANGLVNAINAGTATFVFTESGTGCISEDSDPITVLPIPIAFVEGDNTICEGETTTLSPTTGGTWVSSNSDVATVSNAGVVQAVSQGLAKFVFISDQGCSSNETAPVIVFGKPTVVIDGPEEICLGETTQMNPSTGGTWQSTDPTVATISDAGIVTSVSSGIVQFVFTDDGTGCTSEESNFVTINSIPDVNIIGSDEICIGGTTNLVPTDGGIWTSLNPDIATIENNGEVTGVSTGTATFVFTQLSTGCVSEASESVTINTGQDVEFTGQTELCIGEFTTVSPSSGGTWESSNPAIATIDNNGTIEAKAQGIVNFTFTETSTGCISEMTEALTVNGDPTVFVNGSSILCIGSTVSLSPSSGGTWTSLNPSIATVTNDGIVTGIAAGNASFVFENSTTGCSSDGDLTIVVGDQIPVTITGEEDICIGYTTTLFPSTGGLWVSSNPDIATVTNSGVVTGKAPGKVTFEFIDVSSGCTSGGVTDEITIANCLDHDFNVTVVNEIITGDLSTNDNITGSAIYGNPILISKPGGSLPTVTINSDGTYDFISSVEGKYLYYVPVCIPPSVVGCPKSVFEINVVDNIYTTANPVSNLEFATTIMGPDEFTVGQEIEINTLENDACVYTGGCNLEATSVTILDAPSNGGTTINSSGVITYTPNPGFIGKDTLEYQVCVEGGSKCSSSQQIITVNHLSAVNSTVGADDFGFTMKGQEMTGNALQNDSDPEGDQLSVVPMGSLMSPIAIPGGEYYIDALGEYTFIPGDDFTGSTEIVYTLCDDNVESACTDATIHLLVFDDMSVNIRVYLEGAMMQNGGETSTTSGLPLMRDDLRDNPFTGENYIPLEDPYSVLADPFMNTPSMYTKMGPGLLAENQIIEDSLGVFSVTGDNAIVDWVFVELRSKDDMTVPIATRSGLLQRDGDVVDLDGVSSLKFQGINVDSVYVYVKHRTHLGVMSMKVRNTDLIDFTSTDFETFNFGTSKGNGIDYTGLSQKSGVVNGYNVLWAGDFDSNGKVKFTNPEDDQNIMFVDVLFSSPGFLINYNNAYGYMTGDYNLNGKTKYTNPSDDLNYLFSQLLLYPNNTSFLSNYNSLIEQVPE